MADQLTANGATPDSLRHGNVAGSHQRPQQAARRSRRSWPESAIPVLSDLPPYSFGARGSGYRRHFISLPAELILEWIKKDADKIVDSGAPTKAIAMFRADGEFEVGEMDADAFARMEGWGGLTLYRAVADQNYVPANLGYAPIWEFVDGKGVRWASKDRDVWYGEGSHGEGCYYTVSASIDYSLREFTGELMQGGRGWVYQAKIRPDAKVITRDELNKLPDLKSFDEFPEVLSHLEEEGMKAAIYGYEAIHVYPGEKEEQIVILNKRILVANRASLSTTAGVHREVHRRIAAAMVKKDDRMAEIEMAVAPLLAEFDALAKECGELDALGNVDHAVEARKTRIEGRMNDLAAEIWGRENADIIVAVKGYLFPMEQP